MKQIFGEEKNLIWICLILMLIWGLFMSFLLPPWQTPDEKDHVRMIGEGLAIPALDDTLFAQTDLDYHRVIFQADEKIDKDEWSALLRQPAQYPTDTTIHGVHPSVIRHLPATIGVCIGLILHLPAFWVLTLGEFASLFFYLIMVAIAVFVMPVKKELLLFIAALPISMQQASSLNYDAVLLPLAFLLIAWICFLCVSAKKIGWLELLLPLVLSLWMAYIKLPYILLLLLVFLLPAEKISLSFGTFVFLSGKNKKERMRLYLLTFLLIVVVVIAGLLFFRRHWFMATIIGMLGEPKRSLYLLQYTVRFWREFLMTSAIGQFGWLESQLPKWFINGSYLLLLLISILKSPFQADQRFGVARRIFLWVIFGFGCLLVMIALVPHTILITLYGDATSEAGYDIRRALYDIPYIGGLQGRYFLPFIILPFLSLPQIRLRKDLPVGFWICTGYILVAMILTIYTLVERYIGVVPTVFGG